MSALESIFKFFPPPALLTMRHSGIALSDTGIYMVRFQDKFGASHKLDAHFFEPLAPGIIKSGTIEKPEELITVLKKVKKQYNIDFVAVSIPDEKAYIFHTTVPHQENMNLTDVVAFKIQETVPVSGPNAVFDFTVINTSPQGVEIVVRVVHQKAVLAYSSVFEAAGMRPTLFKIESQAVADAICAPDDTDPHIVIHMEPVKTVCMIVERRAVIFSIVIDVGTDAFVEAVKKTFSVDTNGARDIIKGEHGTVKSHEEIFFAVTNIISIIRDQVIKLQEYWNTKENSDRAINSLIISGFPACLDGFAHYLEMSTEITSKVGNVWENAFSVNKQVPNITFAEALDYAPAIGLALPHALHF